MENCLAGVAQEPLLLQMTFSAQMRGDQGHRLRNLERYTKCMNGAVSRSLFRFQPRKVERPGGFLFVYIFVNFRYAARIRTPLKTKTSINFFQCLFLSVIVSKTRI